MRFAGTASQYSKNAMPQLETTATQSGHWVYLRWPYHAKVMKTFEAISKAIGSTFGDSNMVMQGRSSRREAFAFRQCALGCQWRPFVPMRRIGKDSNLAAS